MTAYVRSDTESFQEEWLQCQRVDHENSIRSDKQELAQTKKRLADIDVLISQLYENVILGTLSREWYQKKSQGYEAEQADLTTTIVNELIKKIIVYAPDKVNGKRIQRIKIILFF